MTTLQIPTPRVFLPLLNDKARDLGAHGGRGSGKSHFFAERLIERCLMNPGTRWACGREVQKSLKQSVKLLLEDKINSMGVSHLFKVLESEIRTPGDGVIVFTGMLNHTIDSIKSLEAFDGFWGAEAQSFSQRSIELVRPTIRKPGSQLWWDWNPETEDSPVDQMLRGPNKRDNSVVVEANWRDNPFFPEVLRLEMEEDRARDYDKYLHIWEGHYRRTLDGSVYAKEMRELYSAQPKRVARVLPIAGKPVDTFWDLGRRDHTSIWFAQLNMGEYRIPDFYQNRGEQIGHYAQVVKDRGYPIGTIWLPHDADQERLVGKTVSDTLRDLFPNIEVRVIPRMAKKAIGHDAVRKILPQCFFDDEKTKEGRKCLERYRYDVDPDTGGYSQNPLHDEFSDGADAFAQLALSLEEPDNGKVPSFAVTGGRGSYMGL